MAQVPCYAVVCQYEGLQVGGMERYFLLEVRDVLSVVAKGITINHVIRRLSERPDNLTSG
jgi:hypothetical protein